MKPYITIICLISILFIQGRSDDRSFRKEGLSENHQLAIQSSSDQIVHYLAMSNGDKLQIRITLPNNYNPNKRFPVLLGPGLDGGNLDQGCRYFGRDAGQHGWILVESLVHMKGVRALIKLLDYLDAHYAVEGFHLLGFSANSAPQFKMARQLNNRISSVTAMPGHPEITNSEALKELESFKVLMVVGEKDHWWKNSAIKARQKMQEYGLSVDLLVVPDGGHILDEFAGRPLFKELEKLRTMK